MASNNAAHQKLFAPKVGVRGFCVLVCCMLHWCLHVCTTASSTFMAPMSVGACNNFTLHSTHIRSFVLSFAHSLVLSFAACPASRWLPTSVYVSRNLYNDILRH